MATSSRSEAPDADHRAGLQVQARALGDPTRHAIFQYLADEDAPVGVAELTDHFGLNHNAIRQHLAKLVDADLVIESTAPPSGRGRPHLEYVLNPSVDSRWGATGPYERLSVLLTEVVRSGDEPVEVGRRAGRRLRLAVHGEQEPLGAFVEHMQREGFEPDLQVRGDRFDVTLETCPFTSAVLASPDVVCQLHLGLAQGLAAAVGAIEVDELVPKDPRRAHCRLRGSVVRD
jgi:predicted ArsR family transcriptional regulator